MDLARDLAIYYRVLAQPGECSESLQAHPKAMLGPEDRHFWSALSMLAGMREDASSSAAS